MKVNIKDLGIKMEVKNTGIELQVCDSQDKQVGDLFVAKGGLTWCKGKTQRKNGHEKTWKQFIAWMEGEN